MVELKIMDKIIETMFSGFFNFIGMMMLICTILHYGINVIVRIWHIFMRMLMVRKHGWPPSHLDADGDLKIQNKNDNIG